MNLSGYLTLLFVAIASPLGKLFIKKSTEYSANQSAKRRFLNIAGLFLVIVVGPGSSISAYYYADNALVAPVAASGILTNILFAKLFLKEGKQMNQTTLLGVFVFVSGLVSVLWTYSSFVGNEINDELIDWGVLVLFFGLWLTILTVSTHTANWFNNSAQVQLVTWSITCATLNSADILASMDKWIYSHEREDADEMTKVIVATSFMFVSNITSYYILHQLLMDQSNPLHIVAAILTCITLFLDTMGDCFVFQRYKFWKPNNYAMAITGLLLMIIGIITLQRSHTSLEPLSPESTVEEAKRLVPPQSLTSQTLRNRVALQ